MAIQTNFPNIKPTLLLDFANVERLDPRITFERASEGRFYGTQVAKAEENLLINSQALDSTGWSAAAATRTANTDTAPDGTSTADKITNTATTAIHGISSTGIASVASVSYALSVFVKKGTVRFVALGFWNSSGAAECGAGFDLDTGTVTGTGAVGAGYSASGATITAVGNNWYRVTVICVSPATSNFFAVLNRSTSYSSGRITESYAGTTSEETLLWGAQLEQRSAVTAYTPTTTQPITNYIPVLQTAAAGVARFDHNPTTFESLGLLIEEQRTNLLTHSEQFDNAAWLKNEVTVSANTVIAPDGTLSADTMVPTTVVQNKFVRPNTLLSVVVGTVWTVSCYVKAGGYNRCRLTVEGVDWTGSVQPVVNFNLATQSVYGVSASVAASTITPVGNGWFRCSFTTTAATNSFNSRMGLWVPNPDGTNSGWAGDGFSGIYIWGAQLEAGAFPTSYIPTVASQVTRSADAASMTGANFSSWYRADEGSFYSEVLFGVSAAVQGETSVLNVLQDNSTDNQVRINRQVTNGNFRLRYRANAVDVGIPDVASAVLLNKVAAAYANGSQAIAVNGTLGSIGSGTGAIPTVNNIVFGRFAANSTVTILNGHIRKVSYYPRRLTNPELQGLTS